MRRSGERRATCCLLSLLQYPNLGMARTPPALAPEPLRVSRFTWVAFADLGAPIPELCSLLWGSHALANTVDVSAPTDFDLQVPVVAEGAHLTGNILAASASQQVRLRAFEELEVLMLEVCSPLLDTHFWRSRLTRVCILTFDLQALAPVIGRHDGESCSSTLASQGMPRAATNPHAHPREHCFSPQGCTLL